ncbi:MAG: hypothetical protein UW30_C0015G0017 [Candidatus Giovannonibacteria bacterium GW2011_GWA2_44_13b]|nr:MAG: hypothetical protein UW30_C0015G0017 [Candidatus Giovannonibacteria bacterium GW2011_GWA2_44_13b]
MAVMKLSVVSTLILIGFASIALFGFMVMEHEEHGRMGCIAVVSQGADCPRGAGLDVAIFHLEAYKSFSLSILADNFSYTLFLFALFFAAMLFIYPAVISPLNLFLRAGTIYSSPFYFHKEEFTRWLSLHEASPQYFS